MSIFVCVYINIYNMFVYGARGDVCKDATEDVEFWCPRVMQRGANSSRSNFPPNTSRYFTEISRKILPAIFLIL